MWYWIAFADSNKSCSVGLVFLTNEQIALKSFANLSAYNSPSNISKLKNDISIAEYLTRFDIILNSLNLNNVTELSQRIEYLIKSGNFSTSFISDDLDKNIEIQKMADAVNIERLNNNPMLIESIDIINLLNLITNDK